MNNAGMTGALVLIGAGLFANAFMGNTQTVQAVPAPAAVAVQGDVEPTIVWYGMAAADTNNFNIVRAWSDGKVERKFVDAEGCDPGLTCEGWFVVSSPTEGLNAAADITFDEVVDGQDLATLLASWGPAPRNPMPPSDCPLGLMN